MKVNLITHRGIEEGGDGGFGESTYEAFKKQLEDGFSLEFDPNFTRDGIVIWHDKSMKRLSGGKDERNILELNNDDVLNYKYGRGRLCTLYELFELIEHSYAFSNALHLKYSFHKREYADRLIAEINKFKTVRDKLFIFDLNLEIARYIKSKDASLHLGIAVAHAYDIFRFNRFVGNTLYGLEEALRYRDLFDWVWLDEWDRRDEKGGAKIFYTKEVVDRCKTLGFKIALVTPEIHASSPGLLGGEAHEDGLNREHLFERIKEILSLNIDGLCTDWPYFIRNFDILNN